MMKYRSLRLSGGSLSITLPIDWIRRHKLNSGDQVMVEANGDGTLRIEAVKKA
jgi:antitoxin component of MazEF toxin-antitoxin module